MRSPGWYFSCTCVPLLWLYVQCSISLYLVKNSTFNLQMVDVFTNLFPQFTSTNYSQFEQLQKKTNIRWKFRRFGIRDWWKHLMNCLGVWVIESLYFEVSKLVWTLYTLVMTILGLKSSFFCMIWVFFPMMGRLVLERMYDRSAIQRKNKDWKW